MKRKIFTILVSIIVVALALVLLVGVELLQSTRIAGSSTTFVQSESSIPSPSTTVSLITSSSIQTSTSYSYVTTSSFSSTLSVSETIANRFGSTLGTKFIEIKAFDDGQYIASSYYSATQLLTLIEQIHAAIGNFNLIRFIRMECNGTVNPNMTFSDWNGTLNTYITAVQQAAGGQIIPDDDLNPYFGASNCGAVPNPAQFYQNAQGLLQLTAVSQGMRFLMVESFAPSFYSQEDPSETLINGIFRNLTSIGWKYFIPQSNTAHDGSFSSFDYGNAAYQRVGAWYNSTSYPYITIDLHFIKSMEQQEPYLNGVLSGLESQILQSTSAIAQFTQDLTPSQQEAALTYAAQNQATGGYIWIYPVLVCQGPTFNGPVWDANRTGALSTIESLINQYD